MPNLLYRYLSKPQGGTLLTAKHRNRPLITVLSVIFAGVMLTGCGQKGALYMPDEAPSNTDFILHKANKADSESSKAPIKGPDISEDPQDY